MTNATQDLVALPPPPSRGPATIFWSCSYCGRRIGGPAEKAGETLQCPHCRRWQTVPRESQPPPVFGRRLVVDVRPARRRERLLSRAPAVQPIDMRASIQVWGYYRGLNAKRPLGELDLVVGRRCPYCLTRLKAGEQVVSCPSCKGTYHADCWQENAGCGQLGCPITPNRMWGQPHPALPQTTTFFGQPWHPTPRRPQTHAAGPGRTRGFKPYGEWSMKLGELAVVATLCTAIVCTILWGLSVTSRNMGPVDPASQSESSGSSGGSSEAGDSGGGYKPSSIFTAACMLLLLTLGPATICTALAAVVLAAMHFASGRSLPADNRAAGGGFAIGLSLATALTTVGVFFLCH